MTYQATPNRGSGRTSAGQQFNRRVEDHYDKESPRIKRVSIKDVLLPRVFDTESSQVQTALAFRRRVLPLCVIAAVLFMFLTWKAAPSQSVPSSTVPVSSTK